jgi:hypothetical protein
MFDHVMLATVEVVKVGSGNTVEFTPGALVLKLLGVAAAGAGAVVALLLLAVVVGWLFAFVRHSLCGQAPAGREAPGQYDYGKAWAQYEDMNREDRWDEEAD